MRTLRRILVVAALAAGALALARPPDPHTQPNEPPRAMQCYQKCMKPLEDCRKKCGKRQRCVSGCTKDLGKCTDKCGGPPEPPKKPQ